MSQPFRANISARSYVEATQAAIAGLGVTLGWLSNSGDLVAEGRLAIYRDAPYVPGVGFHLVVPERAQKKATALFAAHLKQCVTGTGSGAQRIASREFFSVSLADITSRVIALRSALAENSPHRNR